MKAGRRTVWAWFPLLWLAFLVYPVMGFFAQPRTAGEWALFWPVTLGFVAVYARVFFFRSPGRATRWALAGWAYALVAYALLFPVSSGGATAFLIYGGSVIGYQGRVSAALWLAFLNVAVMALPFWNGQYTTSDLGWLAPNMLFTLVAAYANHASFRRNVADARLSEVQAEQERLAADAERERIARDLHDLLGHTLSVIVLKSELAGKLAERDPARAAGEIREVERIGREALAEVRAAVSGYRGSGVNAELARAKVALDTAGVRLHVTGPLPALPPRTEQAAAMLLREAVTNVVRHARAREVQVSLTPHERGWQLVVRDDGVGGTHPEGSGLTGMRERLRAIGGTLRRDGRGGTTLSATLPGEEGQGARGAATTVPPTAPAAREARLERL
ncbi:two-component sensor histidine kinase [Deinococcus seoulensis]|uniref:Two-component sensor histidine kinase n=1 Tax=Deinococcus seoulensis TaxID=1837379 RepID=A0ABQ2RUS4_9DEIO|nr:sensor histidine kinase [Deinococcus seoulensis]GGR58835.1 two-component sensor histidine kinase [Deinococcus seoulensis]